MIQARYYLSLVLLSLFTSHAFGQASLLPPPAGPDLPVEPLPPPAGTSDANSTPWQPPPAGAAPPAVPTPPNPPPAAPATPPAPTPAGAPTPSATSTPAVAPPPTAGPAVNLTPDVTPPSTVAEDAKKDGEVVIDQSPQWYKRVFLIMPVPWDSGVELGLNGSSGNSDTLSIRTGGYIKQSSKFAKFNMSSYYNRTASDGEITQNNAQFDLRNDWLLDDKSPWTLFVTDNVFYDEFKAYNVQTNADLGVGYRFFHEKDLELIGRAGAGTSREFGGPDDRWVPESLLGLEYSQKVYTTQKLSAKVDYFPDLDMVGEFRLVADASWEVELVQPSNLSLKFSLTDRYDSTPSGAEPNSMNYSALMLLKL